MAIGIRRELYIILILHHTMEYLIRRGVGEHKWCPHKQVSAIVPRPEVQNQDDDSFNSNPSSKALFIKPRNREDFVWPAEIEEFYLREYHY